MAEERYPDLHRLIDQLAPEQAERVRSHVLRLVGEPGARSGLRTLGVFDGPAEDLGTHSEEIIRSEAGRR